MAVPKVVDVVSCGTKKPQALFNEGSGRRK